MMQTISAINILRLPPVKIVHETNDFQEVIPHTVDLDVTVRKDSITLAKNQAVTVVASNSTMDKEHYRVFIGLKIKHPLGQ